MSDVITFEMARGLVDRVAQELGLLLQETSGFLKCTGPSNKQRVYIQLSRTLGRIDTTLELSQDDPAYKQMKAPNGSIRSHVTPTMEHLERCLRMLGDGTIATQVPNKPRPFAASKEQARRPKAVAMAIPAAALKEEFKLEGQTLAERLDKLHERVREAKVRNILENPDRFGNMTRKQAEDRVDGKALDESEADGNAQTAELLEVMQESGVEVSS